MTDLATAVLGLVVVAAFCYLMSEVLSLRDIVKRQEQLIDRQNEQAEWSNKLLRTYVERYCEERSKPRRD